MRTILIAAAVLMLVAGCAQTKPATETPPNQAAQVTTPPPTTPATEEPKPAATESTPAATQPAAAPAPAPEPVAMDLKVIHFDFDKYDIKASEQGLLNDNATWLKSNPDVKVQLGGYCDERGTEEYNLALGERRAQAVRSYLAQHGVPADSMTTVSYGEEKPVDPGHDEAAWAKNRRVEFTRAN